MTSHWLTSLSRRFIWEDVEDASANAAAAATAASLRRKYLVHIVSMEYWWSIGGFIGVLAILHLVQLIATWVTLRTAGNVKRAPEPEARHPVHRTSSTSRLWRSAQSFVNIILYRLPIPLRRLHNISNVSEVLCVFAYIGATLSWALMKTPDIDTPSNWSNRAGMMSAVQIPFIVALSGKNNVISFFTGLSHEKLNVVHRAAGRTLFLTAWLHMGGKTWQFRTAHESNESVYDDINNRWGLTAVVALTLIVTLSFRIWRTISYEGFLMGHMVLVFIFILSVTQHRPELNTFVYPGFIFWAFDRFARVCRVIIINVISASSRADATPSLELLSPDTVRLTVRRSKNLLTSWRAGQHFFVIAPGISTLPWEAHPFTPASTPAFLDDTSSGPDGCVSLQFIVRGRDGFTGHLVRHARDLAVTAGANLAKSRTVLVDGPYGQPPNLGVFNTAILISGGSGVSYTLSMILDRIHQARLGKGCTSRVLFVWVIRDKSHIGWISETLRVALASEFSPSHPLDLDIRIFVTQHPAPGPIVAPDTPTEKEPGSSDSSKHEAKSTGSDSAEALVDAVESRGGRARVAFGRPDIAKLIDEELAASDGLKVSVDVSGPSGLASAVRQVLSTSSFAVPSAALRGGPSVTLHTETFGW